MRDMYLLFFVAVFCKRISKKFVVNNVVFSQVLLLVSFYDKQRAFVYKGSINQLILQAWHVFTHGY